MFFLKDLPTQSMIDTYADKYCEVDTEKVDFALSSMRRASLMIRKLEEYFAKYQVSQLRFLVLMMINREPKNKSLTAIEIAERLDVSKPVLSRAINRLIDDEILLCTKHQTDKRAKVLTLSSEGEKLLHAILPGYFELLNQY